MKKGLKITIICLAVILALGGGAYIYKALQPVMNMAGREFTVEAGDSFDPLSALGELKNIETAEVVIDGPEDISKPGSYQYTYSFKKLSETVAVTVKDTVPPEIKVPETAEITDYDIFLELYPTEQVVEFSDKTDVEIGISDSCGLDLNDHIEPRELDIEYYAEDEGGNRSTAVTHLTVVPFDTEPPKISGLDDVKVLAGSKFDFEKDVKTEDDKEGDITLEIDSSKVDLSKAGTYTAVYTATDLYGNKTEAERKITVYEEVKKPAPQTQPEGDAVMYSPSSNASVSWNAAGIKGQPYLVTVNRALCTVTVYEKDADGNYTVPCKSMICSVGLDNGSKQTPLGRFITGARYEWCKMLGDHVHYGRYAIRLDTSKCKYPSGSTIKGIMFHTNCYLKQGDLSTLEYEEYNKLGQPASLGCIRLTVKDARWLYKNCPSGFTTIVYEDATSPGPLGKPSFTPIDPSDEAKRGWEPTDPDANNPWKQ